MDFSKVRKTSLLSLVSVSKGVSFSTKTNSWVKKSDSRPKQMALIGDIFTPKQWLKYNVFPPEQKNLLRSRTISRRNKLSQRRFSCEKETVMSARFLRKQSPMGSRFALKETLEWTWTPSSEKRNSCVNWSHFEPSSVVDEIILPSLSL